jgi:hypothetical protein
VVVAVAVVAVGYLIWPDIAYATLCIPTIRRFIPNTSVKNNTPNVIIPGGSVMTGSKIHSAHLNVDYIH